MYLNDLTKVITVNDLLKFFLILIFIWFFIQSVIYLIRVLRIKMWKPTPSNIYYEIKNVSERCIVDGYVMKEQGKKEHFYLEYKSVETGDIKKRRIVDVETYSRFKAYNVYTRQQSELTFYTPGLNNKILKYRMTRTNDDGINFAGNFKEEDITKKIVGTAVEYFQKQKPKKYVYTTPLEKQYFEKRKNYLDTLPTVADLFKRKKMNNDKNKIRKSRTSEKVNLSSK